MAPSPSTTWSDFSVIWLFAKDGLCLTTLVSGQDGACSSSAPGPPA